MKWLIKFITQSNLSKIEDNTTKSCVITFIAVDTINSHSTYCILSRKTLRKE